MILQDEFLLKEVKVKFYESQIFATRLNEAVPNSVSAGRDRGFGTASTNRGPGLRRVGVSLDSCPRISFAFKLFLKYEIDSFLFVS